RLPYTEDWPGPSQARHILVFFRGNMFRLDVLDADGHPYLRDDLEAALRAVLAAGVTRAAPGTSVGHLTTKARPEWAATPPAVRTRWRRWSGRCSACAWRTSSRRTPWRPATTCCTVTAATAGSTRRYR